MKQVNSSDVDRLKEKDEEAFKRIFNAYKNIVFHECLVRLKNHQDSEDCFQNIFLTLFKNVKLYDEAKGSFDAWFTKLYKNCIINFYNSKLKTKPELDNLVEEFPENKKYLTDEMMELISIVGEDEYLILLYHYKYRFTFLNISEKLDIPYEKTRRLHEDALKKIKNFYKFS